MRSVNGQQAAQAALDGRDEWSGKYEIVFVEKDDNGWMVGRAYML